jgi:tripartite-type tricarboxylate transporter receptor subunit TctC
METIAMSRFARFGGFIGTLSLAALSLVIPLSGHAAGYPEQAIRLVVPYPPGGATDLIGRIIGKSISDELKVPVVVENKGGAAGSIGAGEVAKAKPDAYTLLLAAITSHALYQTLYPQTARYDLTKDFQGVATVGDVPQVLVANPSVKAKSLSELISLAKDQPGRLSIASAGNGSTQQMAAILLANSAGISLIQVPYKGSGPAMTDLVGGQVDTMFGTVPSVQEFVKSDKLRVLAVTSKDRVPTLPDAKTFAEEGIANFDVNSLFGVLAPAGTSADRVDVVARAIEKALASQSIRESLLNHGVVVAYQGPEATRDAVQAEVSKWQDVVRQTGVKAE